jgi:hypothetical protein
MTSFSVISPVVSHYSCRTSRTFLILQERSLSTDIRLFLNDLPAFKNLTGSRTLHGEGVRLRDSEMTQQTSSSEISD